VVDVSFVEFFIFVLNHHLKSTHCSHNARMGLAVFTRITPVMLYLTVFIAIVMYMFAVLGMQLFSGVEPKDPTTAYYHGYNCHMGFDSFGCTIWMLFQVLTTK
jgi:hypothetical protein